MENKLPKRSEVETSLTWKIEDIFVSEAEWEKALNEAISLADEIVKFTNKVMESAGNLYQVLETYEKCRLKLHLVNGYALKL